MSMAVDYRPQPVGGLGYDHHRYSQPQFTNPFHATASSTSPPNHFYQSHYQPAPSALEPAAVSKPSVASMGYVANPAASNLGSDLVPSRAYGSSYASSATSNPAYTATSGARYSPEHIPTSMPTSHPYAYGADLHRRDSYPSSTASHASFSDEMASARGMVAMANSTDVTPRNIYNTNGARSGSHDSYGFPAPHHSHHSSISSASATSYPYYAGSYQGSVDGSSVTDYSSASEDARPLPPPNQLINGFPPPEPQTMMNQFNAKMSPSAQKKHKCKICEKRFTRPSSLQTHMYSHTGEKPFACDHAGCGRHFSVVSNLRRHKKVHKEGGSGSADDES